MISRRIRFKAIYRPYNRLLQLLWVANPLKYIKTIVGLYLAFKTNSDTMALIGSYVYVSSILDILCRFNSHIIYPALIGSDTAM